MNEKKNIYYARTYRRIHMELPKSALFAGILIVPSFVFLMLMIDNITGLLTEIGRSILSNVVPADIIKTTTTDYSIFNTMKYIELPTTYPDFPMLCWNFVVCLFLFFILRLQKKNGKPFAIFITFAMVIHLVSCVFFLFAAEKFPYSLGAYSDIYLKQQIGIWLTFIVLAGLVTAFMGEGGYIYKLLIYITIMCYSIVFGAIRYILFLYILYKFSVLYMALLFFVFGPMFDFSYFVGFYALFVNKTIKDYDFGEKKGVWRWS